MDRKGLHTLLTYRVGAGMKGEGSAFFCGPNDGMIGASVKQRERCAWGWGTCEKKEGWDLLGKVGKREESKACQGPGEPWLLGKITV